MLNSNEDTMDLYTFITYVIAVFMGMLYGWYARERHARRTIDKLFTHIEENVKEEVNTSIIPIVIEQHNGVFYVYNKDTKEFMGQGNTRRELDNNLSKRFPDKKFAADKENLKVLHESL
jgi:hypothetical protein